MVTPLDTKYNLQYDPVDHQLVRRTRIFNSQQAQRQQKQQYDKRIKEETINQGDLVFWHQLEQSSGSSKKLNRRWKGPFRVAEISGPNCTVEDDRGNRKLVHRNHVKKWRGEQRVDLEMLRSRGRPVTRSGPGGR
ncbi:hypothetical protein BLA29_003050 [Euroglyphus maynei]|uniref:Uncharacterized protein n=1 Tax=Euroglyphus maynei TaxID=6958 RepID=A0A1Y3AZ26_EURMA|nr:hypothetical protein BLA29_003050 [Euroglyphus maynei]